MNDYGQKPIIKHNGQHLNVEDWLYRSLSKDNMMKVKEPEVKQFSFLNLILPSNHYIHSKIFLLKYKKQFLVSYLKVFNPKNHRIFLKSF